MMVKMAAAFIASVLLTCCCFVSCTAPTCDLYALKGSDFTVPLTLKLDASKKLTWTHDNEIIFKQSGERISVGKKGDVSANGSLNLQDVGPKKAGAYRAEVFNRDGKLIGTMSDVRLCALESVKQPKVKVVCKTENVTFTCSEKKEDGKVEWRRDGKLMRETNASVMFKAEKVWKVKITCTVSNKVSTKTSEAVKENCYTPNFWEDFDQETWIFIGAGGGIALLLLTIVIICCIRAKRRKRMHIKDEEELRLGWTNPNQHQHQHHQHHHHHHAPNQHHHHHQHQHQHPHQHQHQHRQQPAGHTGPRPHRTKQQRQKKQPDQYSSQPQPSPRRTVQASRPNDEEKPPPLPQPRKKAPKPPQE